MSTSIDYAAMLESDSARLVAALEADRDAAIPWCGEWTVKDCALHVGSLHHVVAQVIKGRPEASFSLFKTLSQPAVTDPSLGAWVSEGTAALVEQARTAPGDDPCWTFWKPVSKVAFWPRRVAQETLVHRWDTERAAGLEIVASDPAIAADGVDEYLDVFVGMLRAGHSSPGAGETVHVHCTDTAGEWFLAFPSAGERVLTREHAKGDVAFRGPAEGLLLFLWGRLTAEEAGVETIGDDSIAKRWLELAPSV